MYYIFMIRFLQVMEINQKINQAETISSLIEQNLESVEYKETELLSALDSYEDQLATLLSNGNTNGSNHNPTEDIRIKTYLSFPKYFVQDVGYAGPRRTAQST